MNHALSTLNHVPYSYTYANASARTSASGFIAADVGKWARQSDDGSLWELTATTPTWIQRASASTIAAPIFTTDIVTSDQNSSSTSKVTTTLEIAVAANTNYLFDGVIFFVANTTSDISFDVTGPASPTSVNYGFQGTVDGVGGAATAFSTAIAVNGTTGAEQMAHFKMCLRNGANSGTVIIRFSTNTGTNTCTVRTGSWLRMQTI